MSSRRRQKKEDRWIGEDENCKHACSNAESRFDLESVCTACFRSLDTWTIGHGCKSPSQEVLKPESEGIRLGIPIGVARLGFLARTPLGVYYLTFVSNLLCQMLGCQQPYATIHRSSLPN